MKKNIKILFILFLLFIASENASAIDPFTGGVDPHDSLLFDGANRIFLDIAADNDGCYIQAGSIRGKVTGKVRKIEIVLGCGNIPETLITEVDKVIEKGDILVEGSNLETGSDSYVGLGIYFSGDMKELGQYKMQSIVLGVTANSLIIVPRISYYCGRVIEKENKLTQEIPVIKGVVTYEDEPAAKPKFNTKGKRSSVKHKQTSYSHEVKIDGSDTIDVIRVYEGAVEVTFIKTDAAEDAAMTKEIEKMGEDMQSGKISMEEMQAKMTEFQNYGQNLGELLTPLEVSEGNKCIITKTSRKVEPLGPGDEKSK